MSQAIRLPDPPGVDLRRRQPAAAAVGVDAVPISQVEDAADDGRLAGDVRAGGRVPQRVHRRMPTGCSSIVIGDRWFACEKRYDPVS